MFGSQFLGLIVLMFVSLALFIFLGPGAVFFLLIIYVFIDNRKKTKTRIS